MMPKNPGAAQGRQRNDGVLISSLRALRPLRISAVSALTVISPQSAQRAAEIRREERFGCASAALRLDLLAVVLPDRVAEIAEASRECWLTMTLSEEERH
jgi:hypothetical protein